jgi:hypothetical protein
VVNVKKVALNGSLVRNMTISHISRDATNKHNLKKRERGEVDGFEQAPGTIDYNYDASLLWSDVINVALESL